MYQIPNLNHNLFKNHHFFIKIKAKLSHDRNEIIAWWEEIESSNEDTEQSPRNYVEPLLTKRHHLGSHPHHFIAADETTPYFVGGKDDTSMLNMGPPSRTRTSINHTNKRSAQDCFLILQIYPHACPLRLLPLLGF